MLITLLELGKSFVFAGMARQEIDSKPVICYWHQMYGRLDAYNRYKLETPNSNVLEYNIRTLNQREIRTQHKL